MLKKFGFKKSEPRESEARLKLQKELFAYSRLGEHGFPHKPSAFAYDPKLKLIAIGTKTGALKVFGGPGVEFSAEHSEDVAVIKLIFVPEQGRIVSQCSNNSLHLWEINAKEDGSVLEEIRDFSMEANKLKTISATCLTADSENLLIGTEGGNIYQLNVNTFKLSETVIYQDLVTQNIPEDFKVNPGAVEALSIQPGKADKVLIGYNRGLIVLWDVKENNADQTYNASQQLESVSWYRDGSQFMSAHADGSYVVWSSTDSTKPKEQAQTPYGPFPCKAINKVEWKSAKGDNFVVFAGGMPRPSYADRHTVSVTQGTKQVVFDFTSRVIDFAVISTADGLEDPDTMEYDDPQAVLVLAEEEIVGIDLQSENWPTYRPPYLASPHSSAITTATHASSVPDQLWNKILEAGDTQTTNYSGRDWPICGGTANTPAPVSKDLLLTGHEDGSVRFWDVSSVAMKMVYKLNTAGIFGMDYTQHTEANEDGDEEWPPFRKVGTFDPYSDDPRLGIQKVNLCPVKETLVIGGTSGQVVVFGFEKEESQKELVPKAINIVSDRDNFIWKGHEPLKVAEGEQKFPGGFQPSSVVQLQPPAAVTALAMHSEWQLLAVGTAHGLGVYDYAQKKEVSTKCTLNPSDLTGTGESAMSRRKSFKKSLRESFRRLRKRRSDRRKKAADEKTESPKKSEEKKEETPAAEGGEPKPEEGAGATAPTAESETTPTEAKSSPAKESQKSSSPKASPVNTPSEGTRTIERAIEARTTDDSMASMVRYLYFADTFLINGQTHTPTLWAGTNAGAIYVFQITLPASDKRDSENVDCQLGKEIHLKHRAPVLFIAVIDKTATPLPSPLEVENGRAKAPDMSGGHFVLIVSEEQFKIFSLPNLKPQNKYKLTAHEGSKVRKIALVDFHSRSDENYKENDLVIMTNMGDTQVFTIPHLRRQLKSQVVRKDNINGIVSAILTQTGEGFFPNSPSEFVRFSLTPCRVCKPDCSVEIKDGVRPPPPEPEPEPEPAVVEATTEATPAAEATETPASDAVEASSDQPADGGAAAEGDRADEQAAADGANDTITSADLTIDSIKCHLSEDAAVTTRVVSSSMSRTVVTKRTITSSTEEGTRVLSSETTTVMSSDDGGASVQVTTATVEETKETHNNEEQDALGGVGRPEEVYRRSQTPSPFYENTEGEIDLVERDELNTRSRTASPCRGAEGGVDAIERRVVQSRRRGTHSNRESWGSGSVALACTYLALSMAQSASTGLFYQSHEQVTENSHGVNGDESLPELRITEDAEEAPPTSDKTNVNTANGQPANEITQDAS